MNKIGRYTIKQEIGRGGMATVYLAEDPRFGRDVAIKMLPPSFLNEPEMRGRFGREARAIAQLEHSAIVPVYDVGEENGQPYLVMRYMSGGTLAARLREWGGMTVAEAYPIIERIASALDSAHQNGIIHRDLKPGNILFDKEGKAYLADFGIAHSSDASAAYTGSGMIGTPAYMSPEQAHSNTLDGRSDIYALGVVMYEMLTGKRPYLADTPVGMVMRHINDPIPNVTDSNPTHPPLIDAVVARAMAKNRDERYPTAAGFAQAVKAAMGDATPATRIIDEKMVDTEKIGRPMRSLWPFAAGLLALLLLGAGVWFGISNREDAPIESTQIAVSSPQPTLQSTSQSTPNEAILREQDAVVAAVSTELPTPSPTDTPNPTDTSAPLITPTEQIEPTVILPTISPTFAFEPLPTPIATLDTSQLTLIDELSLTTEFIAPDGVWTAVRSLWRDGNGEVVGMIRATTEDADRLIVEETNNFGNGSNRPHLVGWSADSRYLFYTIETPTHGCVGLKASNDLFMYDVTTDERYTIIEGNFRDIKMSIDNNTIALLHIGQTFDTEFSLKLFNTETFAMKTVPLADTYREGSASNQLFWSVENDLMLMLYTSWCAIANGYLDFYLLADGADTVRLVTGWRNESTAIIADPNVTRFADGAFDLNTNSTQNEWCDYRIMVNSGAFSSDRCPENLTQVTDKPFAADELSVREASALTSADGRFYANGTLFHTLSPKPKSPYPDGESIYHLEVGEVDGRVIYRSEESQNDESPLGYNRPIAFTDTHFYYAYTLPEPEPCIPFRANQSLFRVPLDSDGAGLVYNSGGIDHKFAPDGNRFAFISMETPHSLGVYNLEGMSAVSHTIDLGETLKIEPFARMGSVVWNGDTQIAFLIMHNSCDGDRSVVAFDVETETWRVLLGRNQTYGAFDIISWEETTLTLQNTETGDMFTVTVVE